MHKYFADVHLELIFYINCRAGPRFSCHWYLDGKVQSPEGLMWHFHVNHLWRHSSQSTLTTAVMKPTPQRAIWHLFFCYKAWELTRAKMCEGSSYFFIALPVAGLPSPGATTRTQWSETVSKTGCLPAGFKLTAAERRAALDVPWSLGFSGGSVLGCVSLFYCRVLQGLRVVVTQRSFCFQSGCRSLFIYCLLECRLHSPLISSLMGEWPFSQ